ncbi:hypothetical protein [Thermopetrobacter sp. TC1]|uniref:hypothetical protein n=1 Tax=Thermopetrobacter sp. TC1 TaxID=1495045 RepID=UPI0012E0152E|nr:hypothetical protein [Thermopetrobacter sp. TC1]
MKEEIVNTAVDILKNGKYTIDKTKGMPLANLLKKIKEKLDKQNPDLNIKESAIYKILREEAKKEGSNILSGGPHRGYYYIETVVDEEESNESDDSQAISEKDLYPMVELWLSEKKQYGVISE